ncbi:MAG: maleylpyruvate isomerase family mycothiol-dependent enzyme, partial [Actinomycetota bacterium]|nr:maleylpyruvate isomerase family mycothiol-dependent enzyme [Actinomycetota bacterium]
MPDVYDALRAEAGEIDDLVAGLSPRQWSLATPAPGWTIAHQVAHLAFIAHLAGLAVTDPEGFEALAKAARADFQAAVDAALTEYLADPPEQILARWRTELATATDALAAVPPGDMVRWLVNPLPPQVIAAAGMMEIFAHGQDVADALGVRRQPRDRWRHIAGFGARTRDFGYLARGLTPPVEEFRFELTGPSGDVWEFGP